MTPPKLSFMTKIYHPSITASGEICIELLKADWSPAVKIAKSTMVIIECQNSIGSDSEYAGCSKYR